MNSDPVANDTSLPSRRPIRLKGYDYSHCGAYFITICTRDRACPFGEVVDREMRLNEYGQVVQECWMEIPRHFPHAELDAFVIMPNHVHGIIWIVRARHAVPLRDATTTQDDAGPREEFGKPMAGSVPTIVRSFKAAVTKSINARHAGAGTACRAPTGQRGPTAPRIWQRGYYEHVIRDDESLNQVREYISDNPVSWALDRENPLAGAALAGLEPGDPRETE